MSVVGGGWGKKKQTETSALNKRWTVSIAPLMAIAGRVRGEVEMWGRGFNTLFIGGASMSTPFRGLGTQRFILVIMVVCVENLKKIYLGRSLH